MKQQFIPLIFALILSNIAYSQNYTNNGTLDGTGTVNSTTLNNGTIAPGVGASNVGQITINGNFTAPSTAIYNFEIGSTTNHDKIVINGAAQLNGTVNISFINGFTPAANDVFNIMTYTSSSGTFASVNLPNLPSGMSWQHSNIGNRYELKVISGASCPTDGQVVGTWNIDATTSVVLKLRVFNGISYLVQVPSAGVLANTQFAGASDVFVVRGKNLLLEAGSIGTSVTITHPYTSSPSVMYYNCFTSSDTYLGLYTPSTFMAPPGYYTVSLPNDGTIYYRNTGCLTPNPPTVSGSTTISLGGSATISASGCIETTVWSSGATGASISVSPTATTSYTAKCKVGACESAFSSSSATITVITNSCPTNGQTVGTWNFSDGTWVVLKLRDFGGLSYLVQVPGASILSMPDFAGATDVFVVRAKNLLISPPLGTISITHPYTSSPSDMYNNCFTSSDTYLGLYTPSTFSIPAGYSFVIVDGTTYYKNTTSCSVAAPTISGPSSITLGQANVSLSASGCSGTVTWSTGATGATLLISPAVTTNYSATCTVGSCISASSPNFQVTVNTSAITSAFLSDNTYASGTTGYGVIRMDKTTDNNPITIGGVQYAKGLGTHANSEIIYNLNSILGGPWTTFETTIGRDDEGDGCGANVQFYVYIDNVLAGGPYLKGVSDAGQFLSFNITGKSTLKLVVDYGTDGGFGCDHADWAMAKVTKNVMASSAYLSDNNYVSGSTGYGSIMLDKNVSNNTMYIGGVAYSKGLGVHAYSELVYNINSIPGGPWTNFRAIIGRDDVGENGCGTNIGFQVYVDNILMGTYVKSITDPGQDINIDITGKSTLKLVVSNGTDNDYSCDHANWAMARVAKGGARASAEATEKIAENKKLETSEKEDVIIIYPQPATNFVKLKLENIQQINEHINIRSSQGAIIHQLKKSQFNSDGILEIDLSKDVPGLYFIEIQQTDGKYKMLKLLKI
jgi:hypothetical protein